VISIGLGIAAAALAVVVVRGVLRAARKRNELERSSRERLWQHVPAHGIPRTAAGL